MQGRHGHLTAEQKQLAFRLRAQDWRLVDIAREIGCTAPMVGLMVRNGKHGHGQPFETPSTFSGRVHGRRPAIEMVAVTHVNVATAIVGSLQPASVELRGR